MWNKDQADDEIVIAFKLAGFYQLTIPAVKPGGHDVMIQLRDQYNQNAGGLESSITIRKAGVDITENFFANKTLIRPTANNLCYVLNAIRKEESKNDTTKS